MKSSAKLYGAAPQQKEELQPKREKSREVKKKQTDPQQSQQAASRPSTAHQAQKAQKQVSIKEPERPPITFDYLLQKVVENLDEPTISINMQQNDKSEESKAPTQVERSPLPD